MSQPSRPGLPDAAGYVGVTLGRAPMRICVVGADGLDGDRESERARGADGAPD